MGLKLEIKLVNKTFRLYICLSANLNQFVKIQEKGNPIYISDIQYSV